MGSRFHPRFYDDAMLKALEYAFRDVCHTLQINDAAPEEEKLKTAVAERIMNFAETGVNDATELSALVLQSLQH